MNIQGKVARMLFNVLNTARPNKSSSSLQLSVLIICCFVEDVIKRLCSPPVLWSRPANNRLFSRTGPLLRFMEDAQKYTAGKVFTPLLISQFTPDTNTNLSVFMMGYDVINQSYT